MTVIRRPPTLDEIERRLADGASADEILGMLRDLHDWDADAALLEWLTADSER